MTAGAETTCDGLATRTWFSWTNHPGITSTGFPSGDYVNPRSPEPQGDCGTCATFALVEAAEISYKIAHTFPNFQWVVNLSEWGVLSSYYQAINGNLVSQNFFCMDSGTSSSAIASKLIDAGYNYIFLESEIPYPIRRTTELNQARNYYPQLEDMRNRNQYPWLYQHVIINGSKVISEEYYDDILHQNIYNNALISENLVNQAKKALTCGLNVAGLEGSAGPLPAALATHARDYIWSESIYNYLYVDEVYSPGIDGDSAGHAIVIVGWVNKGATNVQLDGQTLNWNQIWGTDPIVPGPPSVFLHNRIMRAWAPIFFTSGYTTWAQVENDVSGVFIFIDNHNQELYFAPYFERASLVGDALRFRFIEGAKIASFNYDYFPSPIIDKEDDGVPDVADNCRFVANRYGQYADIDHDGRGDACDDDIDGDGIPNGTDKEPTNASLSTDLNNNYRYEVSSLYTGDATELADTGTNDYHKYRHSGEGYYIDWEEMIIYNGFTGTSQTNMSSFGPDWIQCELNCQNHSQDIPTCLDKCADLETNLEFFEDLESLRLPGRESFACKYQNYFHPLCLKWVEFLLNLRESGWSAGGTSPADDATLQLLSQNVAALMDEMDFSPRSTLVPFRTFTPAGVTALVDARVDMGDKTYLDLITQYPILANIYNYQYPVGYAGIFLPDELKKYNPCDLLHQTKLRNFKGSDWWQEPASGPAYNTEGNDGDPWWEDLASGNHYGVFQTWLTNETDGIEKACRTYFQEALPTRTISLGNTTSYGTSSSYLIETVYACNTPVVSASYLGREVYWDDASQNWAWDLDDDRVRVGLCPCYDACLLDGGMTRCPPIADGQPAVAEQDTWLDSSLPIMFDNQAYDPVHSPNCVFPATLGTPEGHGRGYRLYCTNKKLDYGTHQWKQRLSQFNDVDKAVRAQATHLSNFPLVPSGTTGKIKARYTVRDENTTDWDDTYRSETNQTTAWLDFNADQDCVAMFSVNNWISNHDLVIVPEAELGWQGRPSLFIWSDWKSRKFVLQMDSDQITVKNLLSIPNIYEGGALLSDASFFDSVTFLFGKKTDNYVNKLVRAKWDSAGWQTEELVIAGTNPVLSDAIFIPYDTNHFLLMGKYGTGVRVYRVLLSGNVATVTLLNTLAGYSRIRATRMADHSPMLVVSGSYSMRFYQYNGVRISYLWSSATTQLVQSMEYTGEALLLKHAGNLQVYRIDPVAQTKTPEGDLLPSGSTFYTLVPNRMRMVLSIGSGLSVKGYQQVEGEWFGWPTFLQVQ